MEAVSGRYEKAVQRSRKRARDDEEGHETPKLDVEPEFDTDYTIYVERNR